LTIALVGSEDSENDLSTSHQEMVELLADLREAIDLWQEKE
jgi:hypothetical protein